MSRKPYVRKLPTTWWVKKAFYRNYMLREVSCIFIGAYTALIVIGLMRLSQGRAQYDAFIDMLNEPSWIAFHVVAFVFAVIHTVSWFGLTPKAMPLWVGGSKVPGGLIVGVHYIGWAVVTAAVLFLAGGW